MQACELMGRTLRRAFVPAATSDFFGSGPERAERMYQRFAASGTNPAIIIECPLLGNPSYDVLVGAYGPALKPGTTLPEENPPACRAAYDWAATRAANHNIDLFFELDADGGKDQHAAIHCRHRGDLAMASCFLQAIDEHERAPQYRTVAERLPKGWRAEYAAVFLGRPGAPTRLEVVLYDAARQELAASPAHAGLSLARLGFEAFDGALLKELCALASMSRLCTLQFDICADGSLGSTLSITSCFERMGPEFARMFDDDGAIGRICQAYEDMGVSDGRWRVAEHALFAKKQLALSGGELRFVKMLSLPNCGKAKWVDGVFQPAKLYLLMAAMP